MKPYLVTMRFPMISSEEPGLHDELTIHEHLERQWCDASGIFWGVDIDVDELAPVVAKPTEEVNDQDLTSEDYYDHFVRTQEAATKAIEALFVEAKKWDESIRDEVMGKLSPLLNMEDLVDMKTR